MPRWFDRLRLRVLSLFSGTAVDASMRGELQLHLEEQIDEYIARGMTPVEAREAALRDFGSMARIEEECRDARRVNFVSNLSQDLRYTLRSLARQPLLVLAATVSIAVAVGANTTIFSLASSLLFAMPSAKDPSRPVRVVVLGIGGRADAAAMRQVVTVTGGEYVSTETVEDLQPALAKALGG